ncbi:MAG: P1 family peptidase, partial [Myxococcaceae bacterium]
ECTEEEILNSMCMAGPMTGVNDNHSPALPLDEVRRFLDATKPIFASVRKKPQRPAVPAEKDRPHDADKEGNVRVSSALPTLVRGAEGIPISTKPMDEPETPESLPTPGKSDT